MPGPLSMRWLVFLVCGALTALGCATDTQGETGSLSLDLVIADDVVIDEVTWRITGNGMDMSDTINTSAPGSTASVEVFGLPRGQDEDYTITLEATSVDGEVTCRGSEPFNVFPGETTDVMVILHCKLPQRLGAVRVNGKFNICAELAKAVVSPLQTSVGNDIDLSAIGVDRDNDPITYTWSGSGGSIADPNAASTTYTCQDAGDHFVNISVTDNDEYCDMAEWTIPVTCVPGDGLECINDEGCDEGEICVDNVCVPDLECINDEGCDEGEICVDNECVSDVECTQDEQCPSVGQCRAGVCFEGACETVDVENGTECTLPDFDDAECRMGECVPLDVTLGDDFVLLFQKNIDEPFPLSLILFITGPVETSGVVTLGAFSEPFTVTPGTITPVTLPVGSEITSSDVVEPNASVAIASEAPVTVYGLNRQQFSTDAFAALPATGLGQVYRVMAWKGRTSPSPQLTSQFAIAALPGPDGDPDRTTTVTITPSADAGNRSAGVPYTIEMSPFDAYQLRSIGDLTGTLIESDWPVAVFGGHECANVPDANFNFCDHMVEQIPPVSNWGTEALTVPLATRQLGDTFVMLASEDGTGVTLEGAAPESFTLNAGESIERLLEGSYRITATAPILVAQYSNGTTFDGVTSDPFMMLIPTAQQFLDSYTFATPSEGFSTNFANLVARTADAAANSVLLDGSPVPSDAFTEITGTDFSAAQVAIGLGTHTVEAPNPLGLYVYGFDQDDSYGYPGGFAAVSE